MNESADHCTNTTEYASRKNQLHLHLQVEQLLLPATFSCKLEPKVDKAPDVLKCRYATGFTKDCVQKRQIRLKVTSVCLLA
jgi:hypothetical protein